MFFCGFLEDLLLKTWVPPRRPIFKSLNFEGKCSGRLIGVTPCSAFSQQSRSDFSAAVGYTDLKSGLFPTSLGSPIFHWSHAEAEVAPNHFEQLVKMVHVLKPITNSMTKLQVCTC